MSRAQAARDALDRTGAELTWEMIDIALAAADAVMFSDEAIGRAAEAWWNSTAQPGTRWKELSGDLRYGCLVNVRAIATALKGDA